MYLILKKRHVAVVLARCLLPIDGPLAHRFTAGTAVETGAAVSWGLSFQGPQGNTPVVDASDADLRPYNACYIGDISQKKVYLTFDCGYEDGYTASISDTLKKQNVKAAFFVVGHYIDTNADLVEHMTEEGHIVGNHTYHHLGMAKIQDKAPSEKEIKSLEEAYQTAVGQSMKKLYRLSQGKYSKENLQMASELGYRTIFWSLTCVNWQVDKQPSHEEAMKKLTTRIHPGTVILLHSTSKINAEILSQLIIEWKKMRYTFGTLDELVAWQIFRCQRYFQGFAALSFPNKKTG